MLSNDAKSALLAFSVLDHPATAAEAKVVADLTWAKWSDAAAELQFCRARLKAIPDEQRRLVEGYRKGLYADFMMREDMKQIQKEQVELEKRKTEIERQLAQRQLTESQEARIRSFAEKISSGLDTLDFAGRQELMRLLIEKVLFDGQVVEIQTIINPNKQLCPIHRGGQRG
jgi:DNA repair exonuclease SbcCD ATPase subunit